ncbi:MAG: DUF3179 domain-containing protein [Dehalococcoidia bacterium]|nr:DUF3179 domain-containing protein [Dehalococcoidia bacterium]
MRAITVLIGVALLLTACFNESTGGKGTAQALDRETDVYQTPASISAPEIMYVTPPKSSSSQGGYESYYLPLLLDPEFFDNTSIIDSIGAEGDLRFVPVLLDTMNSPNAFVWVHAIAQALKNLTGQEFGYDWGAWVEWYARQPVEPVAGYIGWKGEYLGLVDPKFKEYLHEGVKHRIPIDKIVWGGVRKDAIPALTNPKMIDPQDAGYLTPEEPVFGVSINGDHRAYPLRIMDWHELFNDVVGGVPVSLSYCTMCGSGILYDTTLNGKTYTFGSSGLLYQSNKLMYDRQTNSLWNNLIGEPVLGDLADSGLKLTPLPVTLSRWSDWLAMHPNTRVLSLDTGHKREYVPGKPYGPYFASPNTLYPVTKRSDRLGTKDWIYAITLQGVPKAYPLIALQENGVLNDTLAGVPLVLVSRTGSKEVRAYSRGQHRFVATSEATVLEDEAGHGWRTTEEALMPTQDSGEKLERLAGHLAYWFGWYVFFPNTLVYEK